MNRGPGLVVLYRWKLRDGSEQSFIDAWSRITELLRHRGSFGSRLHRGTDGVWYGYAQWPSDAVRQRAFSEALDPEASSQMRDAVEQSMPELVLEAAADFLFLPKESDA
jgi:hypothetical protein